MRYINSFCHNLKLNEPLINLSFGNIAPVGGILWTMLSTAILIRASYYLWNTWAISELEFVLDMLNEYWDKHNNTPENERKKLNIKYSDFKKYIDGSWHDWFAKMVLMKGYFSLVIVLISFIALCIYMSRLPPGVYLTCESPRGVYECVNHSLTVIRIVINVTFVFTSLALLKLIFWLPLKRYYNRFKTLGKSMIPSMEALVEISPQIEVKHMEWTQCLIYDYALRDFTWRRNKGRKDKCEPQESK